jgi:hypothetical protein
VAAGACPSPGPGLTGRRFAELFRLEEERFVVLADPAFERFSADGDTGAYAREVAASFVAAFGPSLFAAGAADRDGGVAGRFEEGLAARVRERLPAAGVAEWRVQVLRATRLDG